MKNMDGICQVLPCDSMCLCRHLCVEKHTFPAPAVQWKCTSFAFFSRPLFSSKTFKMICMKLKGRQVETPLNMDPTCTDQTQGRSSRFCRKILLPHIPLAHLPLST